MFSLALSISRCAAPTELKTIIQRRHFYKHGAPLELHRGGVGVKYLSRFVKS